MEIEGGSGSRAPRVQQKKAMANSKPNRIKYLNKYKEKKHNQKKKTKRAMQKRKMISEMAEEGQQGGKDWKVILREKFEQVTQNTGSNLAFGLSRLFHEENRSLVARVVEHLGDEISIEFARRALESFVQGGISRKDGVGERTMGGIFFRLIKEGLSQEDPERLKAIFIKSEGAKKRKHKIRKEKKREMRMGSRLMNPGAQTTQGNPFANVFQGLM